MKFRLDGEILRYEIGCRQATIEEVELFKQRDELLAALELIANESTRNLGSARIVARSAIASVKANT